MKPNGGGKPTGTILTRIEKAFGSYDAFKTKFAEAGNTQFGSGWAWLVCDQQGGNLEILKTSNAGNPMTESKVRLPQNYNKYY